MLLLKWRYKTVLELSPWEQSWQFACSFISHKGLIKQAFTFRELVSLPLRVDHFGNSPSHFSDKISYATEKTPDPWPVPLQTMLSCKGSSATRQDHKQVHFFQILLFWECGCRWGKKCNKWKTSWNGHIPRHRSKSERRSPSFASRIALDRYKSYLPRNDCRTTRIRYSERQFFPLPLLILQTISCFTAYLKTYTHLQISTCPAFLHIHNFPLQFLPWACNQPCRGKAFASCESTGLCFTWVLGHSWPLCWHVVLHMVHHYCRPLKRNLRIKDVYSRHACMHTWRHTQHSHMILYKKICPYRSQ